MQVSANISFWFAISTIGDEISRTLLFASCAVMLKMSWQMCYKVVAGMFLGNSCDLLMYLTSLDMPLISGVKYILKENSVGLSFGASRCCHPSKNW